MKIKIDKEKCIGCGTCVSLCEEVFELSDYGRAQTKKDANFKKNKECIKEAEMACPVQAIIISK